MRILLCDSDPTSRASIVRLLHTVEGCDVEACASGAEAIERLERERFDALMLDTDLPLLDGFETLSLIRGAEPLRTLPTVIVTRDRSQSSVMRSLDYAVVDYLLKPVRMQRLQVAVRAILNRMQREERPAPPPPLEVVDPRTRTLIVDGDEAFRDALKSILEPHCIVATASSGANALTEAWRAVPTVALIGRDIGPIGPAPLARYLSKLGTSGLVKVATPEEMGAEAETGTYTGVVGRSTDPAVVLPDLRRFIKLPTAQSRGLVQQLLEAVPSLRDVVVRTTAAIFEERLSQDAEVRDLGLTDIIGAHALVDLTVGGLGVRLAVQSTTDLIRRLADANPDEAANLQSSVGILGAIVASLAVALESAALDAGVTLEVGQPWFSSGATARDGLPTETERLVVEMAPSGGEGRFRVVLDVWLTAGMARATPETAERLSA